MVGDNLLADIQGAQQAGIYAIRIDAHGSGLMPKTASRPTLNPQPEEVLEVSCIRRNEDKVVDVRNGGNLPVDERWRPA